MKHLVTKVLNRFKFILGLRTDSERMISVGLIFTSTSVKKTTSNTLIYNSLSVRDPMQQVQLIKVMLFLRLRENEFTEEFLYNLSLLDELLLNNDINRSLLVNELKK